MDNTETHALTNKERIGLLAAIEDEIDVTALKIDGLHIWPLLRSELAERMLAWRGLASTAARLGEVFEALEAVTPNVQGWGTGVSADPFEYFDFAARFGTRSAPPSGIDALFLSRPEESKMPINGVTYNTLIDPFIHLVEGRYSYLKIEMGNESPRTNTDDYYPVARLPWVARTVRQDLDAQTAILSTIGEEFCKLERVINALLPGLDFSLKRDVAVPASMVLKYRPHFRRYLTSIRPRAVFLSCYWYPIGMALIQAAKDLSIPTIEIQHGGTYEFNHPYTHWRRFPTEGYGLLPDIFWCWGQREVDMYRRWHPDSAQAPVGIHGGNPSLMSEAYTEFVSRHPYLRALQTAMQNAERVILAPLGTEQGGDIHDIVLRAMQIGPKNWLWLIRGHPHYFHDQWECVERKVALAIPGRYEMAVTSALPLPPLLSFVDHTVGGLSGIWVDSLAYGIRTTFVGEMITREAPDLGGHQAYSIARTPEEIIQSILDHPRSMPEDFRWLIDSTPERARRALETILG